MGLKDLFNKASEKLDNFIERSNSEFKKLKSTKDIVLYSRPIMGGYTHSRAFLEDGLLFFPIKDFKEDDFEKRTIIGIDGDDEYYVITDIDKTVVIKEYDIDEKHYAYDCYTAKYTVLNDQFSNDVEGLTAKELTGDQEEILKAIKTQIQNKSLALQDKKDLCLNLWPLFTECIKYGLKDHCIVIAFSRIAKGYVEDFSTYLLKLFA